MRTATTVALLLAALLPAGCERSARDGDPRGPGTIAMAGLLQDLAARADPGDNPFLNARRAAAIRAQMGGVTDARTLLHLQRELARELLNAGRTDEAIGEYQNLRRMIAGSRARITPEQESELRIRMAVADLRRGEQENCLARHNGESCLLPIRPGGRHTVERGSRAALGELKEELTLHPDDREARWLYNIAAMTVGDYPERVPPAWLIPPSAFASEYEVKRFTDVAPGLGLDAGRLAGGVIVDDFDGDGDLDIMISSSGVLDPLRYFRNNGDGTFSERTREAGLVGEVGGLNLLQADYDNDGRLDALVLRGGWMGRGGIYPSSLLHNRGDGTFEDVTRAAGLPAGGPTQTAAWLDYNGDGWLDLFIGYESAGDDVHPCALMRNNGDGTFTEWSAQAGAQVTGFVKAVAAGDFNNDGRPDLYVSMLRRPNRLLRNDGPAAPGGGPAGPWRFTDVTESAGVGEPVDSFPAWFFDYDNDGWPDLFVSGYRIDDVGDVAADVLGLPGHGARARLYHNRGDGTFEEVGHAAHLDHVLLAMGSNFGDIDNDGWLDIYLGTGNPDLASIVPNRMFRNAGGRLFQDVTTSAGVGHLQKGHGIAFADLDDDGDQDIYEVMGGAFEGDSYRNVLYENPGYGGHFITLLLEGVRANRGAIGARLRVEADGPAGPRSIVRTVGSGGSFGASPLRQEIGLGSCTAVNAVEITWPGSGTRQRVTGLSVDRFYRIREGARAAEPYEPPRFRLSGPRPPERAAAAGR